MFRISDIRSHIGQNEVLLVGYLAYAASGKNPKFQGENSKIPSFFEKSLEFWNFHLGILKKLGILEFSPWNFGFSTLEFWNFENLAYGAKPHFDLCG